ncbi:MAG: hypothetical protein U5K00_07305 [Melioribacteraceae bacterium]|nr:hypothetical protein [Melioribacteraceae bacterium]
MQILSFWLFFQLVNYTVGTTFLIIDKQEIGFYLIIISLIVRFLSMYIFVETVIRNDDRSFDFSGIVLLHLHYSYVLIIKKEN